MAMTRLTTFKMETEEDFDATRWIDRTLIRLATRYCIGALPEQSCMSLYARYCGRGLDA